MSQPSDALCQYARHSPRILRRQLILQLAEQYLQTGGSNEPGSVDSCRPSIRRFQGALLFIDISGFTALSQKLNVEELKNNINEYFSTMLGIVERHDGDVVKFAGDALFIVWECFPLPGEGDVPLAELNRRAVERAVECGREINETCCNHKVVLSHGKAVRRISFGAAEASPAHGSPLTAAMTPSPDISRNPSPLLLAPLQHPTTSASVSPANVPTASGPSSPEEEVAYLNVHSGVSVGLMAGIDIGADNRWEYFLIGEPLSKVAEAEGQASCGDMIMCPESHALIHPPEAVSHIRSMGSMVSHLRGMFKRGDESPATHTLSCGCEAFKSGYCKVKISQKDNANTSGGGGGSGNAEKKKRRPKAGGGHHVSDESSAQLEGLRRDLEEVRASLLPDFKREGDALAKAYYKQAAGTMSGVAMRPYGDKTGASAFVDWAGGCLVDDLARHVHCVMRQDHSFSTTSRAGAFARDVAAALGRASANSAFDLTIDTSSSPRNSSLLNQPRPVSPLSPLVLSRGESRSNSPSRSPSPSICLPSLEDATLSIGISTTTNTTTGLASRRGSATEAGCSDGSLTQTFPIGNSGKSSAKRKDSLLKSSLMAPYAAASTPAEIRNVTVMFIKIQMAEVELLVDSTNRKRSPGSYRFLGTTLNERLADQLLLDRFQTSIEVLSESLVAHGGQMRQFIVDDKGTVCIGTFGLRGSVGDDNAASALQAAHMIVRKMHALGTQCSIGVTVGRAYCGLVGSPNRHEYAVMGPSTNLSARLMCKAPAYGVICDIETRRRDRNHNFVALQDIVAKGYAQPVGTFKPVFAEGGGGGAAGVPGLKKGASTSISCAARVLKPTVPADKVSGGRLLDRMTAADGWKGMSGNLRGRQGEVTQIITFALAGLLNEGVTPKSSEATRPLFNARLPSRCVGIVATDGMGKSHLMSSVAERVFQTCRHCAGSNIQMFKCRFDRFNPDQPFNAWRPVILEMITRLFRKGKKKVGNATVEGEVGEAIRTLMPLLPRDVQHLQPLFGYMGVTPPGNSLKELSLSAADKVAASINLLLALFEVYSETTKNLIFITMESVHTFDPASVRFLNEVHAYGRGVVLLFTCKLSGSRSGSLGGEASNHSHVKDSLSPLMVSDRSLVLELEGLSKAATIELIRAVLHSVHGADQHEEEAGFYDSVFEISGGSPLYATEIAKTLQQNPMHKALLKSAQNHTARTEEVICHRFDQLSTSAQTLLKMVAVMASNRSGFTLSALVRVEEWDLLRGCLSFHYPEVSESDGPNALPLSTWERSFSSLEVKYARILSAVLRFEDFLRIVPNKDGGATEEVPPHSTSAEWLLSAHCTLDFAIPLEQSTVYSLLLDDQKHTLHQAIAEYHRRSHRDPLEEGFHWFRASSWRHAMKCYYAAYLAEPDALLQSSYLESAYHALQGLASKGETEHLGVSFGHLQRMFEEAMHLSSGGGPSRVEGDESHVMTLERVYELFEGDSEALAVGLAVLVRVAIHRKHRYENFTGTQLVVEDALQMLLLTKNPFLMSSQYLALLQGGRTAAMQVDGGEVNPDEMHFCLYDFWPVAFRTMSVYLMNYVISSASASDYSRKATFVAAQFLALARSKGTPIDVIQALCVNALVHNKQSNMRVSMQHIMELRQLYVFEEHSHLLVEHYGADHRVYVVTRTLKYLILCGEQAQVDEYLPKAVEWFMKLTHVASLTLSVLRIVSVLAYVDKYAQALQVLERYESVVGSRRRLATECIPVPILRLYREWLNRRRQASATPRARTESDESQKLIGSIEVLVSSKDRQALESNSLLAYHRSEIMIVLADLYAMKVRLDILDESELTNDCVLCCLYLQGVVTAPVVDTHDLFCKARAVHIVMQILHLLQSLRHPQEYYRKFHKIFTTAVIAELRTEAKVNQLTVLAADVEELVERLGQSP